MPRVIWRFQEFEIDDVRFELRHAGERVAIAPLPLALLIHLAKRHPAAVSSEELLETLWPDASVTKYSLTQAVLQARRALGEADNGGSAIRTVRGRGYTIAAAVERDRPPAPAASSGGAPFVGREAEIARIDAALDSADAGQGRLLFICGEPGIGKSRLLEELAVRATDRSAAVVTGQCREDDGAPPYWPWPEIFTGLGARRDDRDVRASVDLVLEDIDAHAERSAKTSPQSRLSDADARFRLCVNATECLRGAARKETLVVLLEDLHWASPGALDLLRFAGPALSSARVLIAVTYRTAGPPPSLQLEKILGTLGANAHAVPQLELSGFSREEIAAYVTAATGQTPNTELIERLQNAAGGNPLFVRELVPALAIDSPDSAEEPAREVGIPSSLVQIIRSRIERLRNPARKGIEAAAVAGRTFSPDLLSHLSQRNLERVLEDLETARAEGLVEPYRDGLFRFRHDVIRAAIPESLGPRRRIDLHLRIAQALEAGGAQESQAATLAHHYFEAIPRGGAEKAVHHATLAAQEAREALDFGAAAQHYRRALTALERQTPPHPAARCDLLLSLAEVLELTGQLTESRESIAAAVKLARSLRSYPRLAAAALTLTTWPYRVVADAFSTEVLEEALRAVGKRAIPLRARLLMKLAVLRQVELKEADALQLLEEATGIATRLDDLPLRCDVQLHRLIVAQWGVPANHAERLGVTNELLDIAARTGDLPAKLQCRQLRIAMFLETGAGPELDREIELFTRESDAAGCKQHSVAEFRAMRATACGRFEEALRAIDESERLADPLSPYENHFSPIAQRIDLPSDFRDTAALLPPMRQAIQEYPQLAPCRIAPPLITLDQDGADEARTVLDELMANDCALVPRNMGYVMILATLATLCRHLGDTGHARELHRRLTPYAGLQASNGVGIIYHGPIDWYLGVLARLLDRPDEAAERFEAALATTERLGAWPWHAETQFEYGSLLAAGGGPDRARATELAKAARNAAAGFGMRTLQAKADRLASELAPEEARAR